MKVSREQAALNRERIVDVAATLFREHGYDGIGVADLMKSAGLTHGGFYGHFASKEDLLAEACEHALGNSVQRWRALAAKVPDRALAAITESYVSAEHRDHPGRGCAVGALGADVARLSAAGRHALTRGARAQIDILSGLMPAALPPGAGGHSNSDADGAARRQAIVAYAAMIGAVLLARAVDDPTLSDEILKTVAASLHPA